MKGAAAAARDAVAGLNPALREGLRGVIPDTKVAAKEVVSSAVQPAVEEARTLTRPHPLLFF